MNDIKLHRLSGYYDKLLSKHNEIVKHEHCTLNKNQRKKKRKEKSNKNCIRTFATKIKQNHDAHFDSVATLLYLAEKGREF